MYKLFTLLCLFYGSFLNAQSPATILKKHFKAIEKGQSVFIEKTELTAFYVDKEVIQVLDQYLSSEKETIQRQAIFLTAKIGANHENVESRQRAIFQLLTLAQTATASSVESIVKKMQQFSSEDFNQPSKDLVLAAVNNKHPHLGKWIELAGFLQLSEPLAALKTTYKDDKYLRKSVGMALVRSGDEQKLESLMTSINELEVNDDFIYGAVPLLVYARQKQPTDLLFDIILSDEKNCTPNGPDVEGNILCAYRVMEEIAPYIQDFPVEVGMSGDLKVKDYKKALKTVRTWIQTHKEDYKLIVDKY